VAAPGQCPVCQARFRGTRLCSRCGADLGPLMRLTLDAWRCRLAARQALGRGDVVRALECAARAERLQATPRGRALRLLCAWVSARS
jgi:hypothetical protein